jgi:hypothetical protein
VLVENSEQPPTMRAGAIPLRAEALRRGGGPASRNASLWGRAGVEGPPFEAGRHDPFAGCWPE